LGRLGRWEERGSGGSERGIGGCVCELRLEIEPSEPERRD
jgi:hypothetical protein